MDSQKYVFLKMQPKDVTMTFILGKCNDLCYTHSISYGGSYHDRRSAMIKRFCSMEKDDLIKLYSNDSLLLDILKNEICVNDKYKNSPKKEVIALAIEQCIILYNKHSENKSGDQLIEKFRKQLQRMTKVNLIKLLNDKQELLPIIQKHIKK